MNLKNLCLFLILSFLVNIAHGQQKEIDSLELLLQNTSSRETRTENLNWLCYYYARIDAKKGIVIGNKALSSAEKNENAIQIGTAYDNIGTCYKYLGKDSEAEQYYKKAFRIFKRIDNVQKLATINLNTAILYNERSKYEKAIGHFNDAIEQFESEKDTLNWAYSLGRNAYNNVFLGEYVFALEGFLEGAKLLEIINKQESPHYASIYAGLGVLYQKLEKYDVALESHKKSLDVFRLNDMTRVVACQYNEIGNSYSKLLDFDKAKTAYESSFAMNSGLNNKDDLALSTRGIGISYLNLKEYQKSIEYLNKAVDMFLELEDYGEVANTSLNLGQVFLLKKDPFSAKKYYESSVEYAMKVNDQEIVYSGKIGYSKAANLLSEHKLAYEALNEGVAIKNRLISDEKIEELATLKAQYEYDKEKAILEADFEKNKAIDQANIEKQVFIRNTAIGGGIIGMLALAIGFLLVKHKKEAEFNEQLTSSKLQTIRAQLNPHFIFNTLNSINDFIQRNDKETASGFLTRFSKIMRNVLDHSKETEIPLIDEISFLDNYIRLEQQRLDNSFTYNIDVDNTINMEDTLIPPALLQPFIENSIWHGLSQKEGNNGTLNLNISKNGSTLTCIIDDNGLGLKENHTTHQSFGAESVQNRLDLLNQMKGSTKAKVEFKSKDQGISVKVNIPYSLDTVI